MKKTSLVLAFAFFAISTYAQKKAIFELGANYHTFNMGTLNDKFIDDLAKPNDVLNDQISAGPQVFAKLKYAPNSFFEVGLMVNYQVGSSSGSSDVYLTDPNGEVAELAMLFNDFYAQSLGVGYTSNWHLSDLLGFTTSDKNWVRRTHFGAEVNLGIAYSTAIFESTNQEGVQVVRYKAEANADFQGQIGITAYHNFVQSSFFSGIGIRAGYQLLRTRDLRFEDESYWEIDGDRINLDFSGFYAGAYLRIGHAFYPR